MFDLKKEMKNADLKYAISPLIESRIQQAGLAKKYKQEGYAGATGTVEYTPEFPNDKKAWEKMKNSFEEFIQEGMDIIVYDEYGYPSGTARGVVPESNPDFIAKGLYCYVHWKHINAGVFYKANLPEGKFYKALLVGAKSGKIYDVSDCVDQNGNLKMNTPAGDEKYDLVLLIVRRLFEGTHATHNECEIRNYISMSDVKATEKFLEVTHENYYKYLGEHFGKGVRAFFTDEPSLMSYTLVKQLMPILPWMPYYPKQFQEKYGYPFEYAVCAVLLKKGEENVKRRCDFWEYISETVANGYFGTIKKWCRAHGVASTGHLLSEETLQDHIVNYGSFYETLKAFDWPGIDMLGTITEQLMVKCVPFARIVSSVADLYGCGESLSEFSDIKTYYGGVYVSIDEYYKSVNWHTAMGINNFVSLYAFRDGEGNSFPASDVRALNEYTARLNKLMRKGTRISEIALLYPDASMWANYNANTNWHGIDSAPEITLVNDVFCKTSWELFHRQIGFDVVDNQALLKGRAEDGCFLFGPRTFKGVVVPCCDVLSEKIAGKLLELIAKGVKVTFVEKIPSISRETGKQMAFEQDFENAVKDGKATFLKAEELASVESLADATLKVEVNGENRFEEILSHVRVLEDGKRIVLLVNMSKENFEAEVSLQATASAVYEFQANTGDFTAVDYKNEEACTKMSINVLGGKAVVLLFDKE